MKRATPVIFVLLALQVWTIHAFGLEKITHMAINQQIAEGTITEFSLGSYLNNSLGFRNGIEEVLSGYSEASGGYIKQPIWWWIREGGKAEDEPDGLIRLVGNSGRSNNHFHNPLEEEWENAGLYAFVGPLRYTGQSSILWAQNPEQEIGGNWSWGDARKHYYKALTAISRQERERAFADMFRALGQVAHLVQDSSVPAHVRNDIHIAYHYEKWLEKIQRSGDPEVSRKFAEFTANPINFDPAVLESPLNIGVDVPIVKIIDADKYNGSNPAVTVGAGAGAGAQLGLAEYTNANFFSENTINNSTFPYPKLRNAVLGKRYIPDLRDPNKVVARDYYEKTSDGDTGYRLAAVSFLEGYREEFAPDYEDAEVSSLDDAVYEDYAKKLLPRAVGYSFGLLKYFFRGKLQITAVPISYRGTLQILRVKIKNLTPNETMSNGTFALAYRYRPPGGNIDGSNDIFKPAWAMDGSPFAPCTNLESGKEISIDFRIYPALPEKDYAALIFDLAFQGTLGKEDGAVVGKSFKPGWVIFEEEWDRPLPGNHVWAHTGFNWDSFNPGSGSSTNRIEGDYLIKENIRPAGGQLARVNESFLGYGTFPGPFPLEITPNTYLMYKIDEMSMNPLGVGYQIMLLSFTDKLALQISQEGQMVAWNPTTAYYTFNPGEIIVDNIFESFQRAGIAIPEFFKINFLGFDQRLDLLADPAGADHAQRMKIDFVQIVEGNVE